MIITKFEHACFVAENNDESLVIDPGEYTTDFVAPDNVVGIIITHEHPDHLGKEHIKKIIEKNPEAVIVGPEAVTDQLGDYETKCVVPYEGIKVGNFTLEFFGGEHASIYADMPAMQNIGVLINERLYYPGDSFTVPDQPVQVLALPVAAPWMKLSEALEYLQAVKPKLIFPTHDAVLSDAGKALPDRIVPPFAEKVGAKYRRLQEPLEI